LIVLTSLPARDGSTPDVWMRPSRPARCRLPVTSFLHLVSPPIRKDTVHQITTPWPFDGWTPHAVAFDCDGTLVDTESCWTHAQTELFAARGLIFTPAYELAFHGMALPPRCARIAEVFGEPGSASAIRGELLYLVTERISAHAVPRPGALQIVALITAAVPAAVISNAPQSLLDIALKGAGLDGMFTVVLGAEAAARPKPAPDPYLLGCARLGTSPAATLAIEDSATGLRSARDAGLATLGVPSLPDQSLCADAVVSTLEHPGLIRWIGTWRAPPIE
jgi:HAD superfamily hydrolase (TIGR01509 family)